MKARSTASISADVAGIALAIGGGIKAGIGAAIGISVARNFIGWDPYGIDVNADYDSDVHDLPALTNGMTVRVVELALAGDVYQYVGTHTVFDSEPGYAGQPDVRLGACRIIATAACGGTLMSVLMLRRYRLISSNTSVQASGALIVDATSDQSH